TRSDVFAFGAVLYEMLAGVRAFVGTTHLATLTAVLTAVPLPLTSRRADLPADLVQLVDACLQKRAEARPPSEDVARSLNRILEAPLVDRPTPRPTRRAGPLVGLGTLFNITRSTTIVASVLLAVLGSAIGARYLWIRAHPSIIDTRALSI